MWRFSREIQKGDRVLSYSKEKREYIIGTVTESHFYDISVENPNYPNTISVAWEGKTVERDLLSQAAKNSLGSVLTVFRVDQWGDEIERILENPSIPPEDLDVDVEEDEVIEDLVSKALVMIEDKVDKLDPWQMQELVGGLLQSIVPCQVS